MKILAVGDVCGENGVAFLSKNLGKIKREYNIDFTVVNAENAYGNGVLPCHADDVFAAGADVVTLGNHALDLVQMHTYVDDHKYITRPMNLPPQQPGIGFVDVDLGWGTVCVFNLLGRAYMNKMYDDPFTMADSFLKTHTADIFLLDFHANSTAEKKAIGYHLDGRVSAVWGTHTHTQTADEQVLPQGTGFITDIGMCGSWNSVIGVDWQQSLSGFRGDIIGKFRASSEPCFLSGAVFDIDTATKKCTSVARILVR